MSEETGFLSDLTRDGFAAIRGFMNPSEAGKLQQQMDRYIRDVVPTMPPEHVFYEDKADPASLKQMQDLGTYDEWFGELFFEGLPRQVAEQALGADVIPKNLQYFSKPPAGNAVAGGGRATPAHQDGYYFMLDPCEAVTLWLSLDDIDEENGCVRYVRGSHLRGMRPHGRTATLGFSQGITDFPSLVDTENEVAVRTSPGDLLVHHAMTIHRAGANGSASRLRRALGFVYYSVNAKVDEAAVEAYRQRLQADMKAAGRI